MCPLTEFIDLFNSKDCQIINEYFTCINAIKSLLQNKNEMLNFS